MGCRGGGRDVQSAEGARAVVVDCRRAVAVAAYAFFLARSYYPSPPLTSVRALSSPRPGPAQFINWEVHPISPVTKHWFAVASPTVLLTSLAFYFFVVATGFKVLKNVKKDANAKDGLVLRGVVIFHNVFLVTLSLYMCGGCILEAYKNGYRVWGNAYDPKETALAHYVWVFYVSKIYEFLGARETDADADAEAPTIPDASSLARSPLHLAISLINR